MTFPSRALLTATFVFFLSTAARAQEAEDAKPIEASVARLSEDRRWSEGQTTSRSELQVTLRFAPPVQEAPLLRVRVRAASDDQGNDLLDSDRAEAEPSRFQLQRENDTIDCTVRLKAPSRQATQLAELSGEAIFQDPAAAKPPIELTDFRKSPGEFLESEALDSQGLALAYLDEATFEEKGAKLVSEAMSLGRGDASSSDRERAAMAPMKAVFQMGATLLVIRDPDEKVIKVEGVDEAGQAMTASQNLMKSLWMLIPSDPSQKDIKAIRIQVASKEAELVRSFTVEGIALP